MEGAPGRAGVGGPEAESRAADSPALPPFRLIPLKGDVRFHDVVFGYTPEKIILNGISLYAKPGQKIAFVGLHRRGKNHHYQPD